MMPSQPFRGLHRTSMRCLFTLKAARGNVPDCLAFCTLAFSLTAWSAQPDLCQPSAEIQAELQKAASISAQVTGSFAALDKAAPFLALRDRNPDNLFVHESYQDAIHENGIEGHLRLLTKQYEKLESMHPGDVVYHYLYLRTLVGRTTPQAIHDLNDLLTEHPDFAPAHRTLAEIYGTETFRDAEKEKSEKEIFLRSCPAGVLTRRPPSISERSSLIDQAERVLAENGGPDQIVEMTTQGLKELEWRNQRLRAFDWYSRDSKIQEARELRAKYLQAWRVQVRCYRKAGQREKAEQLLNYVEERAVPLRNLPSSSHWDALETLAILYIEGSELEKAARKLDQMRDVLAQDPDSVRAKRIEELSKLNALGMAANPPEPDRKSGSIATNDRLGGGTKTSVK